jgi:hypothetical protein
MREFFVVHERNFITWQRHAVYGQMPSKLMRFSLGGECDLSGRRENVSRTRLPLAGTLKISSRNFLINEITEHFLSGCIKVSGINKQDVN